MKKRGAIFTILGLLMPLACCWAQACPKEPPFPDTNDLNEIIAACQKYGGRWDGGIRGGCHDFPADWCKKSQSNNISMPLPRNPQEFTIQLLGLEGQAFATGLANKIRSDAERAQQLKAERAQQAELQRQREQQKRQLIMQHLLGNDTGGGNNLQLVFDDSALGVNRKAGEPEGKHGDLKLVFDDAALGVKRTTESASNEPGYGINGLPGIYTHGSVDGSTSDCGGYGIDGLPGVYTGGPKNASTEPKSVINRDRFASSVDGLPGIYLNTEQRPNAQPLTLDGGARGADVGGGYGIPGLPGTYTGGAREGEAGSPSPAAATNATHDTAADTGTNRLTAPAVDQTSRTTAQQPGIAMQQLQQTANDSQRAAKAATAEDAAATASQPFDNGTRTSAVDLHDAKTMTVDPARVSGGRGVSAIQPPPASLGADRVDTEATVAPAPATGHRVVAMSGTRTSSTPASTEPYWANDEQEALNNSGILDRHAKKLCDYAQNSCHGSIVMQNVNPEAAKWIESGMAIPKPMSIKAKTARSGKIAGLIPCDTDQDGAILLTAESGVRERLKKEDCPTCKCVDVDGEMALADAGKYITADYDIFLMRCEGDQGPVTEGRLGNASDSVRARIDQLNREALADYAAQHGAAYDHDRLAKLPATVFEYDEKGGRCRVRTLKDASDVEKYLLQLGLSAERVTVQQVR